MTVIEPHEDNNGSHIDFKSINIYTFLTTKEQSVIAIITKNPGVTKQVVVDSLDGKYSRMIVFDTIKELEKYGIIEIKKSKPNSQIHSLYLNQKNPILIEMKKLSVFEMRILDILTKIKKEDMTMYLEFRKEIDEIFSKLKINERWKQLGNLHATNKITTKEYDSRTSEIIKEVIKHAHSTTTFNRRKIYKRMYFELFRVFWMVLQVYNMEMAFNWPIQINNQLILQKLIGSVSDKLVDIQIGMANMISDVKSEVRGILIATEGVKISESSLYQDMLKDLVKESDILQPPIRKYSKLFHFLQHNGLNREGDYLMGDIGDIINNLSIVSQEGFTYPIRIKSDEYVIADDKEFLERLKRSYKEKPT